MWTLHGASDRRVRTVSPSEKDEKLALITSSSSFCPSRPPTATAQSAGEWVGSVRLCASALGSEEFTVRRPRPKDLKVSDADRAEQIFLFDSYYALAVPHWQLLITGGRAKLVVMEALKCSLPSLSNGEDNAVFKSLIGTLMRCPGPGHCADPLFCRAGFFQVTIPESSTQTSASELPEWIDYGRFSRYKCPLRIARRMHAVNVPSTFSCRLQWKARRAEIEVLANQAASLSDDAKRIPVLADTTLLRAWESAVLHGLLI